MRVPASEQLDMHELLAQLEALRCTAVPPPDPVRLRYIEALARRLNAAPPAVQKVLQGKLTDALTALGGSAEAGPVSQSTAQPVVIDALAVHAGRAEPVKAIAPTPAPRKPGAKAQAEATLPAAPLSLLGQLNHHIQAASFQPDATGNSNVTQALKTQIRPPDLKSALRFRETWARISAETEVDQAAIRAPENAGPLNAHNLALRALALMRELSPDYLRRFMSHTEALLWLDQAHGQLKKPPAKAKKIKSPKA